MRSLLIVPALLLGLAGAPGDWDADATASLKREFDVMIKCLDTGDMATMISKLDADVVIFDIDENNAPVAFRGLEEAKKYLLHMQEAMKAQGLKFTTTVGRTECHATAGMGCCTAEIDQTVAMGGQTMGPMKFRGTMVARKVGDGWKWTHWHGSFREPPPAPPAGPDKPAAPPSKG